MLSVTPRHEFFQLGDLVVGYAAENVGQPGLRIEGLREERVCVRDGFFGRGLKRRKEMEADVI